jgi:NADPH:quinone reductase-like Zn-dependent oxidoreductase
MRALTISPGVPSSLKLDDVEEPPASDGDVLIDTLAIGIAALTARLSPAPMDSLARVNKPADQRASDADPPPGGRSSKAHSGRH